MKLMLIEIEIRVVDDCGLSDKELDDLCSTIADDLCIRDKLSDYTRLLLQTRENTQRCIVKVKE